MIQGITKVKWKKNIICLVLLAGSILLVALRSDIAKTDGKNIKPQKYALLSGGGTKECNDYESFYKNIEYVYKTLKILGYIDANIKVLFHGGEKAELPIAEDNATKVEKLRSSRTI